MAPVAVETEFTVVDIIRAMTIGAPAPQPGLRRQGTAVTAGALNFEMCALQDKVRLPVVVELPLQPADGVVAEGTVLRKAVLVGVGLSMALDALGRRVAENMRVMTRVALLVRVRAEQRKSCQAMVEEDLVRPGVFVVAIETVGTLGTVMRVVFFVACKTVRLRCYLEDRFDVTGLTLDQLVRTIEHVVRVGVVIEEDRRPRLGCMAGLAGGPEVTVMVVVFEVTGDAGDVQVIGERVLAMTVATALLGVFSIERKVRIARMIEFRVVPAGRRVAIAALLSAATVVGVVFGVAIEARGRRGLEGLVFVATGAFRLCVFADQRETGSFMVEFDVGPGDGRMAVGALRTHGVAMHVVGLVAGKAVRGRIAMLAACLVAFDTLGFSVFSEQWKIREIVIERVFVEMHDIGMPSFMIGMAGSAGRIAGLRRQTMKSRLRGYVSGDVFMTVETQCALFRTFELRVTGSALFFVFGMTLDDPAGHDQRLDLGIGSFGYHARKSHNYPGQ